MVFLRRGRSAIGAVAIVALMCAAAFATTPSRTVVQPVQPPLARSLPLDSNGVGFYNPPPGARPANPMYKSRFRHARRSYQWRRHGMRNQLLTYSSQIQHVVVIYMENRTPENLFGAYWNTTKEVAPGSGTALK